MSEGIVEVVKIGKIEKHPDADNLSITSVWDYPVVFRTGDFQEDDLAIYVPVDSIVPLEDSRFAFLRHPRIKAARLRGIFSMGLLVRVMPTEPFVEGQDVTEALGIRRWQPFEGRNGEGPAFQGSKGYCDPDPGYLIYYDLEGLLRYKKNLIDGEEVVFTEKIEGENARFLWHSEDNRLYVASHGKYKKLDTENPDNWHRAALKYDLENKLRELAPNLGIYGEIYGHSKKFHYGKNGKITLAVFDILDIKTRTYLNYDDVIEICNKLELEPAPELYRGKWDANWGLEQLMKFADGNSVIDGADHIREGCVVRTTTERFVHRVGRMVFKMKGESYLTMRGRK